MTPPTPTTPTTVADVFGPLDKELLDIHVKRSLFTQLFGTDEARVVLLNRFAPTFFAFVQLIFFDDLVLSLFRVTDPSMMGPWPNLTFGRLADVVADDDATFGASVAAKVKLIDAFRKAHADWRHKRIAHNHLPATQARWAGGSTLNGPSLEQVDQVLGCMRRLMKGVAIHYGKGATPYQDALRPIPGDASALVRHLEELARLKEVEPGEA